MVGRRGERGQAYTLESIAGAVIVLTAVLFALQSIIITPTTSSAVDPEVRSELQQQADEASQETLRSLGFATEDDVVEIGDRLVELERRQHAVEQKLDRVLEHLEE